MEPTPFNLIIDSGAFKIGASSEEYIRTRMEKVEKWTRKFPSRSCHISLQVSERDGMHKFVISLKLPQVNLAGHAEEPHLRNAFDRALKRLLRQLNEFKHLMRREHLHRQAREARFAATAVDETTLRQSAHDRNLERFKNGLGHHLEEMRALVAAEVDELRLRHADLDLVAEDLVDSTLERAIDRFGDKPNGMGGKSWLFLTALAVIDEKVPQRAASRNAGPATSSDAWRVVVDPDEGADEVATEAAAMLGTEELRGVVEEKLATLPRDWRRAFRMHYVDGLDVGDIGELLDLGDDQVQFRLRGAAEFLRDHIDEIRGSA